MRTEVAKPVHSAGMLINEVKVGTNDNSMDGSGQDIFIHLKNGKVIQISPEFNSILLWEAQEDLDDWNLESAQVVEFAMGGTAAS